MFRPHTRQGRIRQEGVQGIKQKREVHWRLFLRVGDSLGDQSLAIAVGSRRDYNAAQELHRLLQSVNPSLQKDTI